MPVNGRWSKRVEAGYGADPGSGSGPRRGSSACKTAPFSNPINRLFLFFFKSFSFIFFYFQKFIERDSRLSLPLRSPMRSFRRGRRCRRRLRWPSSEEKSTRRWIKPSWLRIQCPFLSNLRSFARISNLRFGFFDKNFLFCFF